MIDDFYQAFESRFRGPRELIKARQRVYLPFIEPLLLFYEEAQAVDLGCGRGEWLEILKESGFHGHGVDLDDGMLAACRQAGLDVVTQDALSALKALPDESQVVVSGFHIAEHIDFSDLRLLIQEALRVLKPAGLLILETPNPENITVGTVNFYLDPTHQKPIPPPLLSFLPEYYGFSRVKTLRLQENKTLLGTGWTHLRDVWEGVSPDYAVVAQKAADAPLLEASAAPFMKEYGLTPGVLIGKFDQQVLQASERATAAQTQALQASERATAAQTQAQQASERATAAQTQAQQASERATAAEAHALQAGERATAAQTQAQQASERAENAEAALRAIHQSRSWRLTAPLRRVGHMARVTIQRTKALQLTIKKQIGSLLTHAVHHVDQHPTLRRTVLHVLGRFPALKARLKAAVMAGDTLAPAISPPVSAGVANLTPHARQIYTVLKNKMDRRKKERS